MSKDKDTSSDSPIDFNIGHDMMGLVDLLIDNNLPEGTKYISHICYQLIMNNIQNNDDENYYSFIDISDYLMDVDIMLREGKSPEEIKSYWTRPTPG